MSYYTNILNIGSRIALRPKVNDSLVIGLGTVDSILPIGRGQRQLILGDRYTGKTSIFLVLLRHANRMNSIGSIDGLGTRRLIALYIGINQNLSKLSSTISGIMIDRYCLILAAHAPSSSLLAFLLPLIGVSIGECLRDRGLDSCICSDDPSKHSKSYRQTSSILGKIPSRDASPANCMIDTLLHDPYSIVAHPHHVLSLGAVYTFFVALHHSLLFSKAYYG